MVRLPLQFRISATYKIGQNDFHVIFIPYIPKISSCSRCKLLCKKDFFQTYKDILQL